MVTTDSKTALFVKWLVDSFENRPEKIAIIDHAGERKTSYGELYVMACRVVGYTRKLQLPAHSFIGICLPTSMEYIAAEIGIWLAGHAIVPMGDQFPESRVKKIMEHSDSPLLIDEKVMQEIASTEPLEPTTLPEEDDINSLFYTSGSTGNPKGVLHSFRSFGIPLFPDQMFRDLDVSLMAVTAPMFFVACKLIYDFLTRGETVNVVPADVRMDIRKLEDFLAEQKIEFVFIPPSVLPLFNNKSPYLKVVFTASERVSGVGPKGYKMVNYCGQTETAGIGCTFMIDKAYDNTPIGIPVEPYIYSVQDENGNEVQPGEEGELCYRGDLTPGYYKDPERTAQLYRGGWLHTGDIVRARPDGNLIYVNRKDWMVKINGQRVEPNEVETVFKKIPGIDNAIVKGFTSGNKRQYLCGYYISTSGVGEQEIINYLTSKLPAYMVPVYFVKMDSFPLNMNGKTDRKSLQSPAVDDEVIERPPYEAPQNDIEAKLCAAFERTLGHAQVGVNEDFFLLGGDSIRVMKLQTLCADLSLTARLIYRHRTPRQIAEAISQKGESTFERQNDYPLSQTQLGIFAACMSQEGEVVYNNGVLFRLGSGVDLSRLAKACESMVHAHPFVKTRLYIDDKGNPRQRRNDDEPYQQEIESLSDADFELMRPHLMQPFFLLSDRLFRIQLFRTPTASYLFMDFHHIIFDGFSFEVLVGDMNKAYAGESFEQETWSGFEVAQEEVMLRQTEAYQQAAAWNKEQFGQLDIVSLPEADRRDEEVAYAQEDLLLDIPYQTLEDACQKMGVTPNVLTTTVFGYLLGSYCHAEESLFATVYNGRKDLKTIHTVGMLVKTLPVHVSWQQQSTVHALLQAVKQQLLGSMSNDLYSFNELNTYNSYINSRILFAWQGDVIQTLTIGGEPYRQLPIMENATGEMLVMQLFRQDDGLRLNAEYQSNAYSQAFLARMMQCYRQLLHGFIEASAEDKPLTALSLLSANDQSVLLSLGTGDALNYDTSQTFVSLFVKQAARTPDAIAVVDRNTSITYAELDCQSDILAAMLRQHHVTTDSFVGLLLSRRISFMISVLAVFKAGGAYIPIDYEYPYNRVKYMLDDSQARILITTRKVLERERSKRDGDFPVENLIFLDDIDFTVASYPVNESKPSSLAYMIYTSGSTGQPKGVMVEHQNLLNFLQWLLKVEQLKAGEQAAVHTSFSFDGSVFDLFPPLMCGATLHILPGSMRQDLKAIYDYLTEHHIVGMLLTTQLGMALQMQYDLPLRFLMLGGEKLTSFKPSDLQLFNCYGPTEFTVCSSYHLIDQQRSYDNIPIGRPVPNTISVLVDTAGRLVPRGVTGELCLIGCQLTRGYFRREELTSQKYVPATFMPGHLMYRTGDLVRWNDDDQLEYMGRIDSQTKLRGFRIELGEIENKIRDYAAVTDATVIIHTSGKVQFLVGFYCATHEIAPDALRKALEKQLPDYMIPQQLIQLDSLPMTPNGKVDRKALTEYDFSAKGQIVGARNSREQFLLDLARELLSTDQLGVTDDLTLMGMNSLSAINLVSMASQKGEELKVNDVLRLKTIEKIAAHKATVGDWAQGYNASKPVAVVVQGLTSYRLLQPLITALCRRYSVFVIEPLQEHLHKSFAGKNKSEIVAGYIALIRDSLPADAKVSAFVGHSFGGEFSYRCAVKWQQETGQTPRVLLFDTYFNVMKVVAKLHHMQEYVVPIDDHSPMPFYSGVVDYFEATQMSDKELKSDSDASWRRLLPHLRVHSVSASHFRLLEKQNVSFCLSQL